MTARLSKHFYERLGDQATNELVDWFNAVDATYKAELREMVDLNFARFDAKMGERLADFRTELKGDIAGLRTEFKSDIASLKSDMIKWMFLFWTGTALTSWLFR